MEWERSELPFYLDGMHMVWQLTSWSLHLVRCLQNRTAVTQNFRLASAVIAAQSFLLRPSLTSATSPSTGTILSAKWGFLERTRSNTCNKNTRVETGCNESSHHILLGCPKIWLSFERLLRYHCSSIINSNNLVCAKPKVRKRLISEKLPTTRCGFL